MEWLTYGQILEMASQIGKGLEERGIRKGDRVMLWGENCAQWVAAFFGCAMSGVVVVPMDDVASVDFARRVAQQVEAKGWICSRKHAESVEDANVVTLFEEVKVPALPTPRYRTTRDHAVQRDDVLQ